MNPSGIPDSEIDIEFYAAQTWHKLFPTAWAGIVEAKPDVAEAHRRRVRGLVESGFEPKFGIKRATKGKGGWDELTDEDREYQVRLSGELRKIVRERMKK